LMIFEWTNRPAKSWILSEQEEENQVQLRGRSHRSLSQIKHKIEKATIFYFLQEHSPSNSEQVSII
jgi:hypothetical protein